MKKLTRFETKDGSQFVTEEEALRSECIEDLEYWLESHCEKDDEENYIVESLSMHMIANFKYLTKLINQIKDNTVREIPDEDGGL